MILEYLNFANICIYSTSRRTLHKLKWGRNDIYPIGPRKFLLADPLCALKYKSYFICPNKNKCRYGRACVNIFIHIHVGRR